ncbi:MAG: hypothetical protein ACOC0R_06235, partial [Mariniphaga sp.]
RKLSGQLLPAIRLRRNQFAHRTMPMAIPRAVFSSVIPVVVSDNSVHFLILQKHIRMERTQLKTNKK